MSFRCDGCGESSPNGTPQTKVVTKSRPKVYTKIFRKRNGDVVDMVVGSGEETVEEKNLCVSCVEGLDELS